MSYLENKGIKVFEWPAESPDMSPIENVWGKCKDYLWNDRENIKSKNDVFEKCKNIFFSKEVKVLCQTLYESLPKRIEKII